MTLRARGNVILRQGDYVVFTTEVVIRQHETELKIGPGSIGRFIRDGSEPFYAVVLLGTWHMRVPRSALGFLRRTYEPLPYPWVDNVLHNIQSWHGQQGRRGK